MIREQFKIKTQNWIRRKALIGRLDKKVNQSEGFLLIGLPYSGKSVVFEEMVELGQNREGQIRVLHQPKSFEGFSFNGVNDVFASICSSLLFACNNLDFFWESKAVGQASKIPIGSYNGSIPKLKTKEKYFEILRKKDRVSFDNVFEDIVECLINNNISLKIFIDDFDYMFYRNFQADEDSFTFLRDCRSYHGNKFTFFISGSKDYRTIKKIMDSGAFDSIHGNNESMPLLSESEIQDFSSIIGSRDCLIDCEKYSGGVVGMLYNIVRLYSQDNSDVDKNSIYRSCEDFLDKTFNSCFSAGQRKIVLENKDNLEKAKSSIHNYNLICEKKESAVDSDGIIKIGQSKTVYSFVSPIIENYIESLSSNPEEEREMRVSSGNMEIATLIELINEKFKHALNKYTNDNWFPKKEYYVKKGFKWIKDDSGRSGDYVFNNSSKNFNNVIREIKLDVFDRDSFSNFIIKLNILAVEYTEGEGMKFPKYGKIPIKHRPKHPPKDNHVLHRIQILRNSFSITGAHDNEKENWKGPGPELVLDRYLGADRNPSNLLDNSDYRKLHKEVCKDLTKFLKSLSSYIS